MMQIHKSFRYRLRTNKATEATFTRFAGACRFVWNKIVSINEHRYYAGVPRLSHTDACALIGWWRHSEEYAWLAEVPAQVLQQCMNDLEKGYARLYAGIAKPPHFRKKALSNRFRYPQHTVVKGDRVRLGKIGWVRFWKSRTLEGTLKTATIKKHGQHWYVTFQAEIDIEEPCHPSSSVIGIDLGIATFAAFSDGTLYSPLHAYRRAARKEVRLQQKLSGMVRYSKNWKKQQQRLATLNHYVVNCRNDFLHKLSTQTSKNHAVIIVEDLQIMNMAKSARGTLEAPGRNIAAKSALNRAILDQGWGRFRDMVEYKQTWQGGQVIAVNARRTSQTCPECGHVSASNRQQQALFICQACGYTYHADLVASLNILARGQQERQNAFARCKTG